MAFTLKDRAELHRARLIVKGLETQEAAALDTVREACLMAGLSLPSSASWQDVSLHADAIRDALEPFDSGVREGPQ